jgi:hypothetical protein
MTEKNKENEMEKQVIVATDIKETPEETPIEEVTEEVV